MAEPRRYRVLELVGHGAMGRVYRAEYIADSGFRRIVALKMLRSDAAGPEATPRLRDEARMLGRLRHRAIASVDDLVQLDGQWTIVMDYFDGLDLLRILREGPLPQGAVAGIVAEAAAALHAAFTWPDGRGGTLGLLHRDLKPSNLLVSPHGEACVVDFGVARIDGDREAQSTGVALGSLGYVAPERIEGIDVPAGDVYGLGVVAYELLVGEAFGQVVTRRGDGASMSARHDEALVRAERKLTVVSSDLGKLVLSMLAFEPERRPNAHQVARQARAIGRALPAPDLPDWAAEHVPRLMAQVVGGPVDPLVGRTLAEARAAPAAPRRALPTFDGAGPTLGNLLRLTVPSASSDEPDEVPPSVPPARRRGWLVITALFGLALFAAVGGVGVVLVGAVVWYLSR